MILDVSNIKKVFVGARMTAQLQPLDHALIAVLKNKFKRWLNLEMAKDEGVSPKFVK